MTTEVHLGFSVVPDHPRELKSPIVALGDFESHHPGAVVYPNGPSQLAHLYTDLIAGRPLASQLVLRRVEDLGQLLSLAIFLDREMALSPNIPGLVCAIQLASALQEGGLAHVDRDLARLLLWIDHGLFRGFGSKEDLARLLGQSLSWLREYVLHGKLPAMPREKEPPQILDRGTNGFVLAESEPVAFRDSLIEVYRQGYLRGAIFSPGSPQKVLAFRKSPYLAFDLEKACHRLNQAEEKAGQPPSWRLEGHLLSNSGTWMPRDLIVQLLLRV